MSWKSLGPRFAAELSMLVRFPDFTDISTGAALNETFALLIRVTALFGLVLIVWSTGASIMRAEWLISPCGPLQCQAPLGPAYGTSVASPAAKQAGDRASDSNPAPCQCGGQKPVALGGWEYAGLLLLQVARGVGGVGAICLASGLAGATLGFLFGLPHAVDTTGTSQSNADKTQANGAKIWQSSTNLTKVSDWLTTVIVGVSLFEANGAWSSFTTVADTSANWLFESRHGSPAVMGAALLGGFVLGFMFCYLYTDLIVARLIAATDKSLNKTPETADVQIAAIGADAEVLAPRISRLRQEGTPPTVDQATAAMQLSGIDLNKLVTRRDVKMWSRARAVLNDFDTSAVGYSRLLGMPADSVVPTDAGLLIEAARVLYAAQRKTEAVVFAELALQKVITPVPADQTPDPARDSLKRAIVADAVVLRLAGYVKDYRDAARLIHEQLEDGKQELPNDDTGRLHLLRALANGQTYAKDTGLSDTAKRALVALVDQDIGTVLRIGKYDKPTLREFCLSPATPPADPRERHDDLAALYADDPSLRAKLADEPISTPLTPTGAG